MPGPPGPCYETRVVESVAPPGALPIDEALPAILSALAQGGTVVLEAPPGAGKTTRVPTALLRAMQTASVPGEILVLEPRRVAARAAAHRVAFEMGESVGQTVGYTVRFEDVRGPTTRIRFLTEGVFTEMASRADGFAHVGAVILDEFHERHVDTDVALALCLRARDEGKLTRLLLMSATLDAEALVQFCSAERVQSAGRAYPVELVYAAPAGTTRLEDSVYYALKRCLDPAGTDERRGDILVFLPGAGEIRRCMDRSATLLEEHNVMGLPLHGDLPPEAQDAALKKGTRRKVIYSTNLAESSVTIDGLTTVIDSGLRREVQYQAWLGLSRMRTTVTSKASAAQRAGRAGRQGPGLCIRLYPESDYARRPEHDLPGLAHADLAEVRLKLADYNVRALPWLSAPEEKSWDAAEAQLAALGALDGALTVTEVGQSMRRLPLPPRHARMVVEGIARNCAEDVGLAAALLATRDIRAARRQGAGDIAASTSDLTDRMDEFRAVEAGGFRAAEMRAADLDAGSMATVRKLVASIRVQTPRLAWNQARREDLDACLLHAFFDRVARRKSQQAQDFAVVGLGPASIGPDSAVRHEPWVIALDAERTETSRTLLRMVHGFDPLSLLEVFPEQLQSSDRVMWDCVRGRLSAVHVLEFRGLAVEESASAVPGPEGARVMAAALAKAGLAKLMAKGQWDSWKARYAFCASADTSLPEPTDAYFEGLLRTQIEGYTRAEEVEQAGLLDVLRAAGALSVRRMNELAPGSLQLANHRALPIQYEGYGEPWVESYLQDFFGMASLPSISGKPLVVHLWAPNRRPLQVTKDLPSFWKNHYPTLRKELSRTYPRHVWPEDPSKPVKSPLRSRQ